ncbi:MAG TPA: hypothetical protein VFW87_20215 [Pirellulales bacterium]|nr:hypothetical protein [Pirellulales bacterium]
MTRDRGYTRWQLRTGAWLILFAALLANVALAKLAFAAGGESGWLVGRKLQLQRSLPLTASWSQTPLREALGNLSRGQRVAMLLDRRIDPDRPLSLTIDSASLEDAVQRIADRCHAEVSWFGSLAYVGPPPAARRLRTLAALRGEDAARLSAQRRQVFARQQPLRWGDLATPRELCQSLADEAQVRLESLDLMPHDLWAAADLPPLSWLERLTLITNEFDLTFEFADQGAAVRLAPMVEPVQLKRRYPGGSQPAKLAERYARLAPEAKVTRIRDQVLVIGRLEDHERLIAKPKQAARNKPAKQVFTMRADDQPVSAVLDQLRTQLGLKLAVDEAALQKAGISLDQAVSFAVKQATLEELLAAILQPAGLTFRGESGNFEVIPAAD